MRNAKARREQRTATMGLEASEIWQALILFSAITAKCDGSSALSDWHWSQGSDSSSRDKWNVVLLTAVNPQWMITADHKVHGEIVKQERTWFINSLHRWMVFVSLHGDRKNTIINTPKYEKKVLVRTELIPTEQTRTRDVLWEKVSLFSFSIKPQDSWNHLHLFPLVSLCDIDHTKAKAKHKHPEETLGSSIQMSKSSF